MTPHQLPYLLNQVEFSIPDPGAGGTLNTSQAGCCSIVTAAAEARTLPVPTKKHQRVTLAMKTDGGDCTITCSAAINQAGNTVITMNDAGDFIVLESIEVGANFRWRVVVNDGCSLS